METDRSSAGISVKEVQGPILPPIEDNSHSLGATTKKAFSHIAVRCTSTIPVGDGTQKKSLPQDLKRQAISCGRMQSFKYSSPKQLRALKDGTITLNCTQKHTGNHCRWSAMARIYAI